MEPGSKNGTHILFFLSKVSANEPLQVPQHMPGSPRLQRGPYRERSPHPETFLTYLPRSREKEIPLRPPPRSLFGETERHFIHTAPFIHFLKSPVEEPSSRVPKTGPLWKGLPVFRDFSIYPSRSPGREPSLQVPFTELPQRERERQREKDSYPRPPFNHISKSPVEEPTPGCPTEPPCVEMPIP
jgi:hypothetical protein